MSTSEQCPGCRREMFVCWNDCASYRCGSTYRDNEIIERTSHCETLELRDKLYRAVIVIKKITYKASNGLGGFTYAMQSGDLHAEAIKEVLEENEGL